MAGRGQRFVDAGYADPKPLIPLRGVAMTQVVIENIRPRCEHRFIFLCLEEHLRSFKLASRLNEWSPGCQVISVAKTTEGAACTVLLARELIDHDDALMIANCDQWVDIDINDYLRAMDADSRPDGLIMTMWADHPKWSYVDLDAERLVRRVVEKEVISNDATVGIYNFRRGADFVRAADDMIARNLRVNGEFYVAPAYNQLIAGGARIGVYNVGREDDGLHGLGTPADLQRFEQSPRSLGVMRPAHERKRSM